MGLLRGVKTVFFLIAMAISFLLFSAPVFLVIADTLLPSALLSSSLSLKTLSTHFNNYSFQYSLIDIPIISIIRSAIIICVYGFCDGPRLSRGPYLGITAICSVSSLVFVSLKASFVFGSGCYSKRTCYYIHGNCPFCLFNGDGGCSYNCGI
ncbi:hypothetical protein ES319_D13G018600v1 [Gossypium barbadense]|uniref:MENTAL domain-containing protein n=1 Tax=Gossypium barbadense TaxID=3634 RepID=A0A5J5NG82_GOSBA|nr:hypothetical protein ES319_D13G018600v1 [Gossypium barbadense]